MRRLYMVRAGRSCHCDRLSVYTEVENPMYEEDTTHHGMAQAAVHYAPRYVPSGRTCAARFAHDRDGHRDEARFLDALRRHPAIRDVAPASTRQDEWDGVDAWVSLVGEEVPVPIDVTTRDRSASGAAEKLLAALRRGVIPVVVEQATLDAGLDHEAAYAAFADYRAKGDRFLHARRQAHRR